MRMFQLFVLGLHRQFNGEMEIKRFLTILHTTKERREGEEREAGRELKEERREFGTGVATTINP